MFIVRQDDLTGVQTRQLIALHLEGMQADSPLGSVFALDLSGLQESGVTVWTAWAGDAVASIGALKMLPDGNVRSSRCGPTRIFSVWEREHASLI